MQSLNKLLSKAALAIKADMVQRVTPVAASSDLAILTDLNLGIVVIAGIDYSLQNKAFCSRLSDYMAAYLAEDITRFTEAIVDLYQFSLAEFPATVCTELDLCNTLGLVSAKEYPDSNLLTPGTCESIITELVAANKRTVLRYMEYAKAHYSYFSENLAANAKANGISRVLYIGSYPSIVKEFFSKQGLSVDHQSLGEYKQLYEMLLVDRKDGEPIFFGPGNSLEHNRTDNRWAEFVDNIETILMNSIAGTKLPTTNNPADPVALYKELLPHFEHTEYNFTSTALKNVLLNIHQLEESSDSIEYEEPEDSAAHYADCFQLPAEVSSPYKRIITRTGKQALIVGVSTYGISEDVLSSRLVSLVADNSIDAIIVAGETTIKAEKLITIPLPNTYPATLNAIAEEASAINGYLMYHDCNDPVLPDFFAKIKQGIFEHKDVDIFTLKTICLRDIYVLLPAPDPISRLGTILRAEQYTNTSALVIRTDLFDATLTFNDTPCNTQYEFLFRATLAGAEITPLQDVALLHEYSRAEGKHMQDKTYYSTYLDYIKANHREAFDFYEDKMSRLKSQQKAAIEYAKLKAQPETIQS